MACYDGAYLRMPDLPLWRYHTMAAEMKTSATTATARPELPVDCNVCRVAYKRRDWTNPRAFATYLQFLYSSRKLRVEEPK